MTRLRKEDVIILDKVLDYLIESTWMDPLELERLSIIPSPNDVFEIILKSDYYELEFVRLSVFFSERDLAEFKRTKSGPNMMVRKGFATNFRANGGFASAFQLQIKVDEIEAVDLEKSKVDLELAKKTLNDYPRTKWMARFGFVVPILLFILEVIRILTK